MLPHRPAVVYHATNKPSHTANTLVIWTSEQGMQTPRSKWTCCDLGLRCATLARWPGVIAPGSKSDALIQYIDILPTLNEIAGGQPVEGIDGRSFLPVLKGKADAFREVVYGATHGFFSVRNTQYKYIWNSNHPKPFPQMFMNTSLTNESTQLYAELKVQAEAGNAKAREIVGWIARPPLEELYAIHQDPFELDNLAGREDLAPVKAELRKCLRDWLAQQDDAALPLFDRQFPGLARSAIQPQSR